MKNGGWIMTTAVVLFTAVVTQSLQQLIMFVVNKVVEEDPHLLLSSIQSPIQRELCNRSAPQCTTRSPSSKIYAYLEMASVRNSRSLNISTRRLPSNFIEHVLTNLSKM